jgi:threonylcarbamoyladenosine tRNA methylthiotransferase MtaB
MQYFQQTQMGKTREVLFEQENKNGMIEGYSDNYIRVTSPYRKEWVNQLIDWKL